MKSYLYLDPGEEPLGTAEAAKFLCISMASMTRLFILGRVQGVKDWGDRWRTTPAALRAYSAETKNSQKRQAQK